MVYSTAQKYFRKRGILGSRVYGTLRIVYFGVWYSVLWQFFGECPDIVIDNSV